jgi:hypothetical protein
MALLVTESAPVQTSSVRLQKIPVPKYRESKSVAKKPRFFVKNAIYQVRNGAQDWNRTSDTAIFSRMLYQLSYLGAGQTDYLNPPSHSTLVG